MSPTENTASMIQVEAYKKWVLVSLIAEGKVCSDLRHENSLATAYANSSSLQVYPARQIHRLASIIILLQDLMIPLPRCLCLESRKNSMLRFKLAKIYGRMYVDRKYVVVINMLTKARTATLGCFSRLYLPSNVFK